jgi:hypothetical protein
MFDFVKMPFYFWTEATSASSLCKGETERPAFGSLIYYWRLIFFSCNARANFSFLFSSMFNSETFCVRWATCLCRPPIYSSFDSDPSAWACLLLTWVRYSISLWASLFFWRSASNLNLRSSEPCVYPSSWCLAIFFLSRSISCFWLVHAEL